MQGVLDYAELVHRAVLLARRPEVAERLAAQYDAVLVDEYQDTDAAQVRLLHALAGGGRTLVAFGDPDQSIYAFRGADVNGILEFPETFPRADGRPAPVEVLRPSRRSGAALLAATRLITQRMPLPRLPADKVRAHREPAAVRDGGRVEVYTYPTAGTELDNIADILRRAQADHDARRAPNALCALAALVATRFRGKGMSAVAVRAMLDLARAHGLRALIAPVRPAKGARISV
jgi:superfamily I DNA/RNA helicase